MPANTEHIVQNNVNNAELTSSNEIKSISEECSFMLTNHFCNENFDPNICILYAFCVGTKSRKRVTTEICFDNNFSTSLERRCYKL